MKQKEKAIATGALPMFQILIFAAGIGLTIYLNGTSQWLSHSISYLATVRRCMLPFAVTLVSGAFFGYSFLVVSIWTLLGRAAVIGGSIRQRLPFLVFTIAHISIACAGLVPTTTDPFTVNRIIHLSGAFGFFLLFPFATLLLALQLPQRYRPLKSVSFIFVALYSVSSIGLLILTGSYVLIELVTVTLIGLWSIFLARVVASELLLSHEERK